MHSSDSSRATLTGPPEDRGGTGATGLDPLREFLARHARLFVLTGAGVSTDSGIPDYRDADGEWKRPLRPVQYRHFMTDAATRRCY